MLRLRAFGVIHDNGILIVQRRLAAAGSTDPDAGGCGASSPGSEEAHADAET